MECLQTEYNQEQQKTSIALLYYVCMFVNECYNILLFVAVIKMKWSGVLGVQIPFTIHVVPPIRVLYIESMYLICSDHEHTEVGMACV